MTETEELEFIEGEIANLGRQMQVYRKLAFEILHNRVAMVRGRSKPFMITSCRIHLSDIGARLFFEGPCLRKGGGLDMRQRDSAPLELIEKIEAREK